MPPFGPPPRQRLDDGIPQPKNLAEVPLWLFRRVRGFCSRLFYIVKLVWEAAPAVLILMALFCLLDGLLPVIGAYISRDLLNAIAALLPRDTAGVDLAGAFEIFRPVFFLFILQFSYMFFKRLLNRLNSIVTNLAGEMVSNHIKMMIIRKSKTVDQQSFDRPEFYEKLENANREAGMRPIHIITATFNVISALISVVSFVAVLTALSAWAPVIVIVAVLPGAVVNYYYRHRSFNYMRRHSKERREMNYYSGVMVNKDSAKEIKLLGLGDTFEEKYKKVFTRYFAGQKKLIFHEGFMQIFIGFISVLANCALFAYVAYHVVFENGQIGDYTLYTGALTSIASYVSTLVSSTAQIYEGTLFIDNMITFMNEKVTIAPLHGDGLHPAHGVPHTLELRHVTFRYPGAERDVIRDVNLTFRSGERIVLVGLNGAGKTTLIKLITRLYDPTEGEILLDGRDIREYAPDEYHALFGIIFQDFGKYAVTVRENIEFGDIRRPHTEEDVTAAAIHGNAAPFIRHLPEGYDTPLTRMFEENGTELSGGQWQKLAVSRAFYKDSDILILDEPTAALDPLAEQEVYDQFTDLSAGRISVFVSHRLSGAVTASRIVVLEHGEVVETGNHEQLMDKQGRYFVLFSTQASRYTGIDYEEEADRRAESAGTAPHRRPTREEILGEDY